MSDPTVSGPSPKSSDWLESLRDGGEMGQRVYEFDWGATSLGPIASWPQSLRITLSLLLFSQQPMMVVWGPELVQLYNDRYRPILGTDKHPMALGRPGREVWPEVWDLFGPMLEGVMSQGKATWLDDQQLFLERRGYLEETYFTYGYTPVRDETGKVGGVLCTCIETTEQVIGERRLRTLRDLGARTSEVHTVERAGQSAMETLGENTADLPFALLYLLDEEGDTARLTSAAGVERGTPACPATVDLTTGEATGWPLAEAARSGRAQVDDVRARFGDLPGGPWSESPASAVVLALDAPTKEQPAGLLVIGLNPRLELDDSYCEFLQLVADRVASALADARAYEEAHRRADALAELDRAKTTFFHNVSHEFRTPLTLLMGPLGDALNDADDRLPPSHREPLEMAHRNGRRLLKLVNALLDFSRIEAGRTDASYVPTDLATRTKDLASNFRSAAERAGLALVVDCPALSEPAYVDRDMWEKVVLNLLSNAFKYTFEGSIEVRMREAFGEEGRGKREEGKVNATDAPSSSDENREPSSPFPPTSSPKKHVVLRVSDTGTGIPEEELPHLFERFHRIEGIHGRTDEGTGIGLALVQKLVELHGGQVEVTSTVGAGTTFTVKIPMGTAHLPAEHVGTEPTQAPEDIHADAFADEIMRWLPHDEPERPEMPTGAEDESGETPTPGERVEGASPRPAPDAPPPAHILVADDNADMRAYLRRVLSHFWTVEMAADGRGALEAVRTRVPDVIVADVMMPHLDGFALVEALNEDERTRTVPVIILSARAGEEARVEGLQKGASDYMVKPFSARELVARVGAQLDMVRRRKEMALRAVNETLEECVRERTTQVRKLAAALTLAEHQERHRIARLLHDDLQQLLYGIQLKARTILRADHQDARREGLEHINELLNDALTTTRQLTVNLSPPVLEGEGLTKALRWLTAHVEERYGLKVTIEEKDVVTLPREELRVLLFRIVRELLFSVVNHAGAERATVRLFEQDHSLTIEVIGGQRGPDRERLGSEEAPPTGFRLDAARERLHLFDGRLDVDSRPAGGLHYTLSVPLKILEDDPTATQSVHRR